MPARTLIRAIALRRYENHVARIVREHLGEARGRVLVAIRKGNPLNVPLNKRDAAIADLKEECAAIMEAAYKAMQEEFFQLLADMGMMVSEERVKDLEKAIGIMEARR